MTETSGDNAASEATLFDVDEYRTSDIAHRHAVTQVFPDSGDATERLLRGGLPIAVSQRWQPLRCGLVNLYLFDNEVFPFAGGRLLLRGDNGAGKSRVLALTLPLLLDGRLHPSRVEPDRDSNRQIAWNLLLDDHQDRTGYTWIEFGCVNDTGEAEFVTLGVGLRAVRGRGITDHWMFISDQRIGSTLSLITPERRVASKRFLTDSLADSGQIFESSTEYRRAVDERLFRLGDRYEALLDLLLQLRQPQLAKKLDLAGLEAALVQAMPPVSSTLLSDAADAFRSLDQERETLHGLQQAQLTVQEFLRPYRRHLRHGIRRAAGRMRSCHSQYEQAGKSLRDAQQKYESLIAETAAVTTRRDETVQQHKVTQVALQTLRADPAMKQAERLNGARQLHDAASDALRQAIDVSRRLDREVRESSEDVDNNQRELQRLLTRARQFCDDAGLIAAPASLQHLHAEQFATLNVTDNAGQAGEDSANEPATLVTRVNRVQETLAGRIDHWVRMGEHLAELHQHVTDGNESLKSAVRRLDDAQDRLQAVADELTNAKEALTNSIQTVWNQLELWWRNGRELTLTVDDLDELQSQWIQWAQSQDGSSPAVAAADAAIRRVSASIATERSALQQALASTQKQQTALQEENSRLQAGESIRPPVPVTRDTGARSDRAGAALWELIDFLPAVRHSERAGWEAALEASGLLDAWVTPDGKLYDSETLDTQLMSTDQTVADVESRLSRVLSASAECTRFGIEKSVIGHLLDCIGSVSGCHSVWVSQEGRWQNGPLTGRWSKAIPQYVGNDVRDEWRQRRISEIEQQLTSLAREISDPESQMSQLAHREQQIDVYRGNLPDDGPIRSSIARVLEIQRQQQQARSRVQEATDDEREKRQLRDEHLTARNTVALDVGLSDWADKPEALLQRLESYRTQQSICVEAWRDAAAGAERAVRSNQHLSCKQLEKEQQDSHHQQAQQNEQNRLAALEELQRTVGVDAQEIIQRIAVKEDEITTLEQRLEAIREELRQTEKTAARLEARLETLGNKVEAADAQRRVAAEAIAELADLTLLPTADDRLDDVLSAPGSLTGTVELARRIEKLSWKVPDVDDEDAWKRSQRQIYDALEPLKGRLTSFSMNAEPEFIGEHICRVQIRHQADLVTPNLLVKRLSSEVDEHERVLSENERTILEKHLLGEVAGELHERMHQARELVESMNREVSGRPMKTGMQMRFRWESDLEGPAGLEAACQVLATGAATWSDEDRRELGEFLHEQITISREQEDAGSRLEQLTAALDYRRWHRLRIDRRASQDQDWKLLTRKTYGSGSGGEKAIALTLPQVAAAAAYYRTADHRAPRLILMDEVFAGISGNNRAACMELLAAFDLDVVMTSESEWGCYPTVPELAICQLTRVPELAAIDNTVFVWNGSDCVTADTDK